MDYQTSRELSEILWNASKTIGNVWYDYQRGTPDLNSINKLEKAVKEINQVVRRSRVRPRSDISGLSPKIQAHDQVVKSFELFRHYVLK